MLKEKASSRKERGSNTKPKTPGTLLPMSKTVVYGRKLTQKALAVPCQYHSHPRWISKPGEFGNLQPSRAKPLQTQELNHPIWTPCNPASVREAPLTQTPRKAPTFKHKNAPEPQTMLKTTVSKEDTLESEHQEWADYRSNDNLHLNHHTSREARRQLPCIQRSAAVARRPTGPSTSFTTQATQRTKCHHCPIHPRATGGLPHTRHPCTNPNNSSLSSEVPQIPAHHHLIPTRGTVHSNIPKRQIQVSSASDHPAPAAAVAQPHAPTNHIQINA